MAQFGFRISDQLAEQFDAYAEPRGGRSEVLRQLMEAALRDVGKTPPPPPAKPSREGGNWEGILVKMDVADFRRLDEEASAMAMSRGQWILALVRRRLHGGRHYGPTDRTRIALIINEFRKIAAQIAQTNQILRKALQRGAVAEAPVQALLNLGVAMMETAEAVHHAFLGNDRYWEALEPLRKKTPQP